jgi:hypothetical protein
MRESRPYGSVRGARDETRVPTATMIFAAIHESVHGTFETYRPMRLVSVRRVRPEVIGAPEN